MHLLIGSVCVYYNSCATEGIRLV